MAVKDQIVKKNKCGTTERVEEHFLRHVQGSRWRESHRRSPERLFRGPAKTKNPKECTFRARMAQAQMEGG